MTPEQYRALSANEKAVYDDMTGFMRRLSERFTEVADLLKRIVDEDHASE